MQNILVAFIVALVAAGGYWFVTSGSGERASTEGYSPDVTLQVPTRQAVAQTQTAGAAATVPVAL